MFTVRDIINPQNYSKFKFDASFGSFILIGDDQWMRSSHGKAILSKELMPIDLNQGILLLAGLTTPEPKLTAVDHRVHDAIESQIMSSFAKLYNSIDTSVEPLSALSADAAVDDSSAMTVYSASFDASSNVVITLIYAELIGLVAARFVLSQDWSAVQGVRATMDLKLAGSSINSGAKDAAIAIRDMAHLHWRKSKAVAKAKQSAHMPSIRALIDAARANNDLQPLTDIQFDEIAKIAMQ